MAFLEFRNENLKRNDKTEQLAKRGCTDVCPIPSYPILSPCLDAPDPTGFAPLFHTGAAIPICDWVAWFFETLR